MRKLGSLNTHTAIHRPRFQEFGIQPQFKQCLIKGLFSSLTGLYVFVTYRDTQDRTPSDPSMTEWDVCWPVATWYISWHVAICLSVVTLPSKLFKLDVDEHNLIPSPDWRRLTILSLWYLTGIPVAYVMRGPCSVEAPGTWGRGIRVVIEGIVAFGLAGCIYGLGRCLLPVQPRSRAVVLPFLPEKKSPTASSMEPNCAAVETV
ncbi:hypothetical protein EDB85DRAFT_1625904 [Lactarius pseudohatsudake]|nr:hypothetical protein EDB85DRAFT_1625904 [Lactarius pseudohatsudake]